MATLGRLMMGADMKEPTGPGLVMVNVDPVRSSTSSFPLRAPSASSLIDRAIPTSRKPSALRTRATTSPD